VSAVYRLWPHQQSQVDSPVLHLTLVPDGTFDGMHRTFMN